MKLKDLLSEFEHSVVLQGNIDADITGLAIDSRKVKSGDLFIAIKGRDSDGHDYISMAVQNGANALIIDNDKSEYCKNEIKSGSCEIKADDKISSVSFIGVKNTRDVLSKISNHFYGYPAKKFNLIGVTGTNGKTSVTVILRHILNSLGRKTGLIGTIANYCGDEVVNIDKTTPTTPDCVELAQIMETMAQNDVEDVIMEVSSMGLKTKRVRDLTFDVGVYTNISPEHLDDHGSMDDYKRSKRMLFEQSKKSVVNIDDDYAEEIVKVSGPCLKYGIRKKGPADLYADSISYSNEGVSFRMMFGIEQFRVTLNTPSEFAVYNVLAAAGTCLQLGIPFKEIREPIQDEIIIPGRYEILQAEGGFTGIIDYAHTEVALENLLRAVKANPSYNRVISVFGCGGDRDPGKREPMGKVSGENSDYTIVTSDNPRTEDPQKIVDAVEEGIKKVSDNYEVIVDRKQAIKRAVEMAEKDDVIVIAGKGHETYQILKDKTIDFDDKEIFQSFI